LSFEQKTYNSGGTLTATTVDSYCYDNADRLSSYNPASGVNPFSGLSYDSHGNIVNMGAEIHGYDSADRHVVTKKGSDKIEYVRDASDRIVTRKLNGTVANRYAYTASADTPSLTLDAGGAVVERTVSLPGGVLVTTRGSSTADVWSYPNLHGDIVATTNGAGLKAGATRAYDPFGNPLGTTAIPDNSAGAMDYGWHGEQQRPLEHQTGYTPLIEMGARQYSPLLGRFLEIDPVPGGNANDYIYPANPIGMTDLDGNCGVFGNPFKKCGRKHKGQRGFLGGVFTKVYRHTTVGFGGCVVVCFDIKFQGGKLSVGGGGVGIMLKGFYAGYANQPAKDRRTCSGMIGGGLFATVTQSIGLQSGKASRRNGIDSETSIGFPGAGLQLGATCSAGAFITPFR
jgi:RHS repeat-associated protein